MPDPTFDLFGDGPSGPSAGGEDADRALRPAGPDAPLADRLRPRTLAEVVGQDELVGEGGVLRRLLAAGHLPSIVLHGPPGSGKTTIARLLAQEVGARLVSVSAVSEGVPRLREVMREAGIHRERGRRTVLFVDEIHRLSKSQQDFLLPFVESGVVTLVGATTEHPAFEIIPALLSRTRVLVLRPLARDALRAVLERALRDGGRGSGEGPVELEPEAVDLLLEGAAGDARQLLNALEAAMRLTEPGAAIGPDRVREGLQTAPPGYDASLAYQMLSAFHKSLRASRGDAALYWAARMLRGGEDPLVLFRRLVAAAYEDVGLADPRAGTVATSAMQAFERLGPPEGFLPLANAILYVSQAPKSNRAYAALARAREAADRHPTEAVPVHLRNPSTPLMREWGYGEGYRYAHEFDEAYPDQECLPGALAGERYYEPSDRGFEREVRDRMRARGQEG